MAKERRSAEDLSIAELEALLARKKLEARQVRVRQFRRSGRALSISPDPSDPYRPETNQAPLEEGDEKQGTHPRRRRLPPIFNRVLLLVEIAAVGGLLFILLNGAGALQQLNQEVAEALALATPSPTPLITAVVLPSGHTPPTSPGGARPNEAEIPANLRPLVQSMPVIDIPVAGPEHARSMSIPALWNDAAPVVQGDGWEQLKKGVGQYVGSAKPGENGNMVLSAHNDIFGELFRDLDQLKPGDEIIVNTSRQEYIYRVTGIRIVEPTEVSVLNPTAKPTVTLISCYPYLVDSQRIVVFGELSDT